MGLLLAAARLRKAWRMAVSSEILGLGIGSGVLVSSGGADEERKSWRMTGSASSVSLGSEKES